MDYARLHAQHLRIGFGVVEAARKTLVAQRIKRSGQRWSTDGGQASYLPCLGSAAALNAWGMVCAKYRRKVAFTRNGKPFDAFTYQVTSRRESHPFHCGNSSRTR